MVHSTDRATLTVHLHKEISHLRHELKVTKGDHPPSSEQIKVGDYLLERLVQLGVTVSILVKVVLVDCLAKRELQCLLDSLRCSRRFQPRWVP